MAPTVRVQTHLGAGLREYRLGRSWGERESRRTGVALPGERGEEREGGRDSRGERHDTLLLVEGDRSSTW